MIIKEIYIENFGKFHQFSMDFNANYSPVVEKNGWGKSTIAAFIQAMFYGLPHTRKKNINSNHRKKFEPWQGGTYGGYLVFTSEGQNYRVERWFGEQDDKISIINTDTGLETKRYSERLGEELFGVKIDTYQKTTFFPQFYIDSEINSEIHSKLSEKSGLAPDIFYFQKANDLLKEAGKKYKKRGNKGKIFEIESTLFELEKKISVDEKKIEELQVVNAKIEENIKNKKQIMNRREKNQKEIKVQRNYALSDENKKQYKKWEKELSLKKEEAEYIYSGIMRTSPSKSEILEWEKEYREISKIKNEINVLRLSNEELENFEILKKYFKGEVPSIEKVKKIKEEYNKMEEEEEIILAKKNRNKVAIYVQIAILLVAVMVFLKDPLISGIILALNIFFLVTKKRLGKKNKEISSFQNSKYNREYFLTFLKRYLPDSVQYKNLSIREKLMELESNCKEYEYLSKRHATFDSAQKEYDYCSYLLEEKIIDYTLQQSWIDIDTILGEIERSKEEYFDLLREIEYLERNLNENVQNMTLQPAGAFSYSSELEEKEKRLLEQWESCIETEHKLKEEKRRLDAELEDHAQRKIEVQNLKIELLTAVQRHKNIENAVKFLDIAKDQFVIKYLEKFNVQLKKLIKIFDPLLAKELSLDINLNYTILKNGAQREKNFFSIGIQEIVDFCVRMALMKVIYEKEKPVIILDDPFVNFDESNLANAKKVVLELAKEYQVITLTCHPSRI